MNPQPGHRSESDRAALVDQLSRLDSADPGDPMIGTPATVSGLKAELDTLIAQLREPVGVDPFVDETGLRRAHELVLAIGAEPKKEARRELFERGRIGPYELLEKLGEGGMGAVYKALHSSLEKIVAIKVLPRDRLHSEAISRFKREMKAVGKLDHPNIVRATDAGEADGEHFLVMEYVDGVDLSELLRRVGRLSAADACELVRQAAVGLQHAHQRGMVHRDIKPSNITLTWGDEHAPTVKVLDMGLALLNEPMAPTHGELTSPGLVMGSLEYMSPEQSQDTHHVDIRADVYSLGATLFKLLSGVVPFSGEEFDTPGKHLVALATKTPPSLARFRGDLPTGLIAVVDRMLARDPAERPATPAEVAQALAPFALSSDLSRLANLARHPAKASTAGEDQVLVPTVKLLSLPDTSLWKDSASREALAPGPMRIRDRPGADAARLAKIVSGVAVVAMLGGVLLFGGQISRIVTNQGQIVIETDGAGIEVVLKDQAGKVLVDGETKREITFKAGEYNIEVTVKDSAGEQRFVTDHFTLTRNDKKIVDARWDVAKAVTGRRTRESSDRSLTTSATGAVSGIEAAIATDPDRRAAEWVLSIGGEIKIKGNGPLRRIKAVGDLPQGAFELSVVDLSKSTKVSDAGLAHFQNCKNLTELYLNELIEVTDAGLTHFRGCKLLIILNLRGASVTDAGLIAFQESQRLTKLDLSYTKITEAGLAHFRDCRNLASVELVGTQVSDAVLVQLKVHKNIGSLDLYETQVSNAGLAHLKDFEKLFALRLMGPQVSDASLAHLKDCKNLRHLDLDRTQVTDNGLEMFGDWPKLHVLLKHTKVTATGVKKLSAALPQSRIEWDGGVIEPLTSADRRAAEYVFSIYGRVTIREDGREWKPGRVNDLPRGPFELTAAQLDSNPQVTDAGLANFRGCQNLTTLDLQRNKLSDAGLVHFKDCKKLENLSLLALRLVTDEGLANFWDCENLTSLNLDSTQLTDAGLSRFQNLKNLTNLNLAATRVTDAGLSHLKECRKLTTLNLGLTSITDIGLANFQDCHNLMVLGLSQTQVSDAGLAQFKNLKNLFRVELDSTQVSDAGLVHLKQCNNMTFLSLSNVRMSDASLDDLAGMSRLQHLNLGNTRMSLDGRDRLRSAFSGLKFQWSEPNRSVAIFVLALGGSVEISQRDEKESHPIKAAADLPRELFQVRRVSLAGVDKPIDKLLPELATLRFPEFDRLETLDLSGINVPKGPQPFSYGFLANIHGLRELNLADAGLNDESLFHLPKMPTLKRLVLDGNDLSIGNRGFSRLSDFTQLESLDLRRTKLSLTSIAELKQALPKCLIAHDAAEK